MEKQDLELNFEKVSSQKVSYFLRSRETVLRIKSHEI